MKSNTPGTNEEKQVLIGQLATLTDTRLSTLRFWLKVRLFDGFYTSRGKGMVSRYSFERSAERIKEIKRLKENGMSVNDIVLKLTGKEIVYCKEHKGFPVPCTSC